MLEASTILLTVGFAVYGVSVAPIMGRDWFRENPCDVDILEVFSTLATYLFATVFAVVWIVLWSRWFDHSSNTSQQFPAAFLGAAVVGAVPLARFLVDLISSRIEILQLSKIFFGLLMVLAIIVGPTLLAFAWNDDTWWGILGVMGGIGFLLSRCKDKFEAGVKLGPNTLEEATCVFIKQLAAERMDWHQSCSHNARTMKDLYGVNPLVLHCVNGRLRD